MMLRNPKTKAADSRDLHVGQRVKARRKILGISQERLAQALGITFQQVQKYEAGTNRISSSRLADIAVALGAPIAFFYEGIHDEEVSAPADPIAQMLMTRQGLELARAFLAISDSRRRRALVELAKTMASAPAEQEAD